MTDGVLAGKAAIVTGAAQGIGRGIASELARAGARVVIADRNLEVATKTTAEFTGDGFEVIALALDVTDDASVEECVRESIARFGRIDILVNNAGIHREKLDQTSTIQDFEQCFDVNTFGIWRMAQAIVPHFREHGSGKIVNIASVNGRVPWADTPAYSASKAAAINLTQSLAVQLGQYDINVNAVCPGSVVTPMADQFFPDLDAFLQRAIERRFLKHPLNPEHIGRAVVFFASPNADMITGQSLNVDGGLVMN